MATRSTIAVKLTDGKYKVIYCHFDGYPEGVGAVLNKHYSTQEKAESAVSLGDLSSLAESMECPKGHTKATPVDGYSVAYGRDRKEEGTDARIYGSMLERRKERESYNYTWDGESWIVE